MLRALAYLPIYIVKQVLSITTVLVLWLLIAPVVAITTWIARRK
jgi:hypothetical protein